MQWIGLNVMEDLVDAYKQSDLAVNRLKLDMWSAKADTLGVLLGLSTS
jgi:hypothetical protein